MKPKDFQIEWLTRLLASGAGAAKSPTLLDVYPSTFPEGGIVVVVVLPFVDRGNSRSYISRDHINHEF